MLTINYTKTGTSVGDNAAENLVCRVAMYDNFRLDISSGIVVTVVQALVAEGKIRDIRLEFEGEPVAINEYGAICNRPDGFCDLDNLLAERTLIAASRRHRLRLNQELGSF